MKDAEEQAKILGEQAKGAYVHGRADILLRILNSAHFSAEQRKEVVDELFYSSLALPRLGRTIRISVTLSFSDGPCVSLRF